MITNLKLKNFRSYKDINIELSPGVNVFIGSSNAGKTNCLRAINYVLNNRPVQTSYVSYWNRGKNWKTEKNKPLKNETSAELVFNDGKFIKRIRTKDLNGYEIPGNKMEAIKTSVPEQVTEIANMDSVNIQEQHDKHFLLSESAAEVGRIFNKTINLDIIDKVLNDIETMRRNTNTDIKNVTKFIADAKEKLESYNWTDRIEKRLTKLKEMTDSSEKMQDEFDFLIQNIADFKEKQSIIDNSPDIDKISEIITKCQKLNSESIIMEMDLKDIDRLINEYKTNKHYLDSIKRFDNVKKLLDETIKINDSAYDLEKSLDEIGKLTDNYKEYEQKIIFYKEELALLKNQIPDICPLCNGTGKIQIEV